MLGGQDRRRRRLRTFPGMARFDTFQISGSQLMDAIMYLRTTTLGSCDSFGDADQRDHRNPPYSVGQSSANDPTPTEVSDVDRAD